MARKAARPGAATQRNLPGHSFVWRQRERSLRDLRHPAAARPTCVWSRMDRRLPLRPPSLELTKISSCLRRGWPTLAHARSAAGTWASLQERRWQASGPPRMRAGAA